MAQTVKRLSMVRETQVLSLGWEDPLEKEVAIHSSTIAWKIHGQRNLVGYSPWGRKELDMTEQLHVHVICQTVLSRPWELSKNQKVPALMTPRRER